MALRVPCTLGAEKRSRAMGARSYLLAEQQGGTTDFFDYIAKKAYIKVTAAADSCCVWNLSLQVQAPPSGAPGGD